MKKTVLITGASRGIGRAIAVAFAKAGYNLIITCSKSETELLHLKNDLERDYSVDVLASIGDISDFEYVTQLFSHIEQRFHGVDVLVNNAGISYVGLLTDMTIDEWNHILGVNLTSVFSTCKLAIPHMLSRKSGKIINISSVWGNVGASCEVAYSACKGGMNSFTRGLAKELAPSNIQVNAIACGCIDTQMNACFSEEERATLTDEIPAGRFGMPEEVASAEQPVFVAPADVAAPEYEDIRSNRTPVLLAESTGEVCELYEGSYLIGRSPEADFTLPVQTVSARHARLSQYEDGWVIEDLGSKSGTMVNGKRIGGPQTLFDGDHINVGGVTLRFYEDYTG